MREARTNSSNTKLLTASKVRVPLNYAFRWYFIASIFVILYDMQVFNFLDREVYGEWAGKSGDKITQSLNLLMIVASSSLIVRGFRKTGGIGTGGILAIAAVGYLLISALWSIDPYITIRRSIVYLFCVVGALGIARNLRGEEFLDLLGRLCFLSAVASLVLLIVSPDTALTFEGELRGIFIHKNVLGPVMAAGVLAILHGMRSDRRRRVRRLLMLITLTVATILARSGTSLVMIFALSCANMVIIAWRNHGVGRIVSVFLLILGLGFAIFVVADPVSIVEMMGKDATLTGRTEIWPYVIDSFAERPILGWGFSAFWSPTNPSAVEISNFMGFSLPNAQNGLLDMLLDFGVLGSVIFITLWIRNFILGLQCIGTSANEIGITSVLWFGIILLFSITEPVLTEPAQIATGLFFIMGFMCEAGKRAAGWRGKSGLVR